MSNGRMSHLLLAGALAAALLLAVPRAVPEARAHHPMRVAFICPADEDYWFWKMTVEFMHAAARDLDIGLEVFHADWKPERMVELTQMVADWPDPPDYLIITNEKRTGGEMLEAATRAGIPVAMMTNVFLDKELERYGRPRTRYPNYLLELRPDNFAAGRIIARTLVEAWRGRGNLDEVDIAGFSGDMVTHASVERVRGLRAAVDADADLRLLQVVPASWERERVRKSIPMLLSRYGELDAIWTASDGMALGALDGLVEAGLDAGREVMVGGCGFHPEAVEAVARDRMTVTVGGHFMDGGRILVMLHDRYHGRDFLPGEATSHMFAITRRNVERYLPFFRNMDFDSVDFRRFSKHLYPETGNYDFTLADLLD